MKFFSKIKKYDLFKEVNQEYTKPSKTGAIMTFVCSLVLAYITFSQIYSFFVVKTVTEMYVENSNSENIKNELKINIDIDVFNIRCESIDVNNEDALGKQKTENIKIKKNKLVNKKNEGCNLKGDILIEKIPGSIEFYSMFAIDEIMFLNKTGISVKFDHKINDLSFGTPIETENLKEVAYNPLSNIIRKSDKIYNAEMFGMGIPLHLEHTGSYQYYLKVVPTKHTKLSGETNSSYQFSSTYQHFSNNVIPTLKFSYEFSPITIEFKQTKKSFLMFFIEILGVVGGVYAGFSLLNTWVNLSMSRIARY